MKEASVKITAIICLTVLECVALFNGIDGALFGIVAGIIGGIAGYKVSQVFRREE